MVDFRDQGGAAEAVGVNLTGPNSGSTRLDEGDGVVNCCVLLLVCCLCIVCAKFFAVLRAGSILRGG